MSHLMALISQPTLNPFSIVLLSQNDPFKKVAVRHTGHQYCGFSRQPVSSDLHQKATGGGVLKVAKSGVNPALSRNCDDHLI
jgi:hypothetical protein